MKASLLWSAMGGMFLLFIGYVVWQQNAYSAVQERCASLERQVVATSLDTRRQCESSISELRIDTAGKISSIDKKQDVEFAKINAMLQQISGKLLEIQAGLEKIKQGK